MSSSSVRRLPNANSYGLAEEIHHVSRRLEILDQHFRFPTSPHADLRYIDFRSLVGSKQDIFMGRIFLVFKVRRREMPAQMIAPSGGDMHRSKHFLVLNIAPGNRKKLGPKPQFA